MTATALIMAGGHGTRMRASGVEIPKPLVPILGVPLLERNVHALIRHHLTRIAIVVPKGMDDIGAFVEARLRPLAEAAGVALELFVEETPLGNIGGAGAWRDRTRTLLVVYADNLTTLDLGLVLAEHGRFGADLTLATHLQPFRMPFGEVRIEDGDIRAYVEKPTYSFPVCSAISVLGARALAALPDDRPTGLSDLTRGLIEDGARVRAFPHAAPWIDVNDAVAIDGAGDLVMRRQREFDLWADKPSRCAAVLLAVADRCILLAPPASAGERWTLPTSHSSSPPSDEPWIVLDEFDGSLCRFDVYRAPESAVVEFKGAVWRPLHDVAAAHDISRLARRVAAMLARQPEHAA